MLFNGESFKSLALFLTPKEDLNCSTLGHTQTHCECVCVCVRTHVVCMHICKVSDLPERPNSPFFIFSSSTFLSSAFSRSNFCSYSSHISYSSKTRRREKLTLLPHMYMYVFDKEVASKREHSEESCNLYMHALCPSPYKPMTIFLTFPPKCSVHEMYTLFTS